jgi:AcrR family transcriptional regulator
MTKVYDREQLVEVAARVFGQKGFEGARLEDIAAELGLLKGSLYYHVRSKYELLFLVLKRIYEPMVAKLEHAVASEVSPREKLRAAVRSHLEHYDEFHMETPVQFVDGSLQSLPPEYASAIRAIFDQYERLLREVLDEGIRAGEFRADLDLSIVKMAMLGMCNWLPRWYRKDGPLSIQAISDIFADLLLQGLEAKPVGAGVQLQGVEAQAKPAGNGARAPRTRTAAARRSQATGPGAGGAHAGSSTPPARPRRRHDGQPARPAPAAP